MARIQINDLNINKELNAEEMQDVVGGRWRRRRRHRRHRRRRKFVGYRTVVRRRRVVRWVRYRTRVRVYRWV